MTKPTNRTLLLAGVATACALLASQVSAASVSINTETGMAMETKFGIRGDTGTRGNDLAGARVSATFADGKTEMAIWEVFNPFATGGVNGDRWSFFQDDLGNVSVVTDGRTMTAFTIDASTSMSFTPGTMDDPEVRNGASLYDISVADDFRGEPGSTPGSGMGHPFRITDDSTPGGSVAVTYSGAVNLVGMPAAGDLFTTMTVDLTGLTGGGIIGTIVYTSDQDTLEVEGDLRLAGPAPVPLPAGLPLLLAGLGGLAAARRFRRS